MPLDRHALENCSARWGNFVDGLALSEDPLRTKLAAEYTMTLMPVLEATIKHLPEEYAGRLSEAHRKLHERNGPRGAVAESLGQMDDYDVREVANTLLEISHVVGAYALRFDES